VFLHYFPEEIVKAKQAFTRKTTGPTSLELLGLPLPPLKRPFRRDACFLLPALSARHTLWSSYPLPLCSAEFALVLSSFRPNGSAPNSPWFRLPLNAPSPLDPLNTQMSEHVAHLLLIFLPFFLSDRRQLIRDGEAVSLIRASDFALPLPFPIPLSPGQWVPEKDGCHFGPMRARFPSQGHFSSLTFVQRSPNEVNSCRSGFDTAAPRHCPGM